MTAPSHLSAVIFTYGFFFSVVVDFFVVDSVSAVTGAPSVSTTAGVFVVVSVSVVVFSVLLVGAVG